MAKKNEGWKMLKTAEDVKALKPGQVVRWTSQAMGSYVEKEGVVLAQVPAGTSGTQALAFVGLGDVLYTRLKFDYNSVHGHRVLVKVDRGTNAKGKPVNPNKPNYYCPGVGKLVGGSVQES